MKYQNPTYVKLTDEERISGKMSRENMAQAVIGFQRDGVVILENAVDPAHCDALNKEMKDALPEVLKDPHTQWNDDVKAPLEKRCANINQRPSMKPELLFEDIWANKLGYAVLSNIMGPNACCNYINGNTALAMGAKGRQRVHADIAHTFPHTAIGVCFNFYLEDASAANGSTELWLGSARESSFRDHLACKPLKDGESAVKPQRVNLRNQNEANILHSFGVREEPLEERRKWAPPIQPTVKKGSIMLRDMRIWHAGIANPGKEARVMLCFNHTPAWYDCPTKIALPESARSKIEEWSNREDYPINFKVEYKQSEQEAKNHFGGVDLSSSNSGFWEALKDDTMPGYVLVVE